MHERIDIHQTVDENLGNVIGVQTDTIQGDVYGHDVYQVQLFALSEAGRRESWERFLEATTPPYKFLAPYGAQDRALFRGRDREIAQLLRKIGEERLLTLYGATGVGKTSLVAAGLIPELTLRGALVVYLPDYRQSVEATLYAALRTTASRLAIDPPADLALPALLRHMTEAIQGTLVLVLDHVEQLFERGHDEVRSTLLLALDEAFEAIEPHLLRVVLVVQEEALGQLGTVQTPTLELLRSHVHLLPLDRQQARAAIEEPLTSLDYPIRFLDDLVDHYLVPDLDDLTPDLPDRIQPTHLQIVCERLYRLARDRDPPHVTLALYLHEAKGAPRILARYIEESLETRLAGNRPLAERLLSTIAADPEPTWVRRTSLVTPDDSDEEVGRVLDRLVESGLVVARRLLDGEQAYAFVSRSEADAIRQRSGSERFQANDVLERVWQEWLTREALASKGQLRFLAASARHLTLTPIKALLLLCSAVARDESRLVWLEAFRESGGAGTIRRLEVPDATDPGGRSHLVEEWAASLLGLREVPPPGDAPQRDAPPFGPVAWAAVSHPDPAHRESAALALTSLDRYEALNRLGWALRARGGSVRRWWRGGEMRRNLTDVDTATAPPDAPPWAAGLGAWIWRVRRNVYRERSRLAWLTIGGGLGAGLAVGALRAVISGLAGGIWSQDLALFGFWAILLGAPLAFGLTLARLLQRGPARKPAGEGDAPATPQEPRSGLLSTAVGALFFGSAHWLLADLNAPGTLLDVARTSPSLIVMGFVAGLGVSLALTGLPRDGARRGWGWLPRLAAVTFAFTVAQWGLIVMADGSTSLHIGLAGSSYKADFEERYRRAAAGRDALGPRIKEVTISPTAAEVSITVRAADDNALSSDRAVGVESISIVVGDETARCDGASECRATLAAPAGEGPVEIEVRARDGAGNESSLRDVFAATGEDDTPPTIAAPTLLSRPTDLTPATVHIEASDAESGIERIAVSRLVAGRDAVQETACKAASCRLTLAPHPPGRASYQVSATNRTGLTSAEEFTLTYAKGWWPTSWFDRLALLDAALLGSAIALGMMAGLTLSARWMNRWHDLLYRAGD